MDPKMIKRLERLIRHLTAPAYGQDGLRYHFEFNTVVRVLILMKQTLAAEPSLLEVNAPVAVVGDIHGQYSDLLRLFSMLAEGGRAGWAGRYKFLFLGDYVDRGSQSLEVIMLLFSLKALYPNRIHMLRGNHEIMAINVHYGFRSELIDRFGNEQGRALHHMLNEAFTYLPLACLVGGSMLCMHGGISPKLTSLDSIRNIPKPLKDPHSHELACDLLWADPMRGLKGFKSNHVRGLSVYFGEDALDATMKKLDIKMVVRAHQMMTNGFGFFAGMKLVTVFSAPAYYPTEANSGAVMVVETTGKIGFRVLKPSTALASSSIMQPISERGGFSTTDQKTSDDTVASSSSSKSAALSERKR